jgi:hypothetical protein
MSKEKYEFPKYIPKVGQVIQVQTCGNIKHGHRSKMITESRVTYRVCIQNYEEKGDLFIVRIDNETLSCKRHTSRLTRYEHENKWLNHAEYQDTLAYSNTETEVEVIFIE